MKGTQVLASAVVLAVACLASVTVLLALGVNANTVLEVEGTTVGTVVLPVLGALLYGKVETINNQTNGNTSALIELVRQQSAQLASMPPAPPRPPAPAAGVVSTDVGS